MNDNSGWLSTTGARPLRVRALRSAALQLAARAFLSLELSETQALDLARDSSLTETVKRLKERFESGVVRGSAAVARDRKFQRKLAVEEVIFEQQNPDDDGGLLQDFIRTAVAKHDRYLQEKQSRTNIYDRVTQESKRFTMVHLQFRDFMQRCDTLHGKLFREMDDTIGDAEVLARVKSELDRVFARHIRRAVSVIEIAGKEAGKQPQT